MYRRPHTSIAASVGLPFLIVACHGNAAFIGPADEVDGGGDGSAISNVRAEEAGDGATQGVATCGTDNCSGCCANNVCYPGTDLATCGSGGQSCQSCAPSGLACVAQRCAEECGSGCAGCCSGNRCLMGTAQNACGHAGAACSDCTSNEAICEPSDAGAGGLCSVACTPANCVGCCDANGVCQLDQTDSTCGGGACQVCGRTETCINYRCVPQDGGPMAIDGAAPCPQNCLGCCDTQGSCQAGFTNTECGQMGATCVDCTAQNPASTCDLGVSPRVCASAQTTCPAAYSGCSLAYQETAPSVQHVCSVIDLQNAADGCSAGPHTSACFNYFAAESVTNVACGNCLEFFDQDVAIATRVCTAPYVDATCNRNSACINDCIMQSCAACADPVATAQCETQVLSSSCSAFAQANACVTQALGAKAAFCNPASYQGNFGAWLQAVGSVYCGQ